MAKKIKNLDLSYVGSIPKWDNIEIEAVHQGDGWCEPVHDENTRVDFYSVYLHEVDGGVRCIADLPTKELALQFADLLRKSVLNYVDNGYMKEDEDCVMNDRY